MEYIKELYVKYGNYDYIGEDVSQIEHMIQCAMLAGNDNQDDEVIIACFLHDVGHLIGIDNKLENDNFGIIDHEKVALEFLRESGFKYPIPELVYNHVNAKRYLIYKNPDYYNNLSNASKNTLIKQGGVMTELEANIFEKDKLFELSLKVRSYDEKAKDKKIEMKKVEYYFELIKKYLIENSI